MAKWCAHYDSDYDSDYDYDYDFNPEKIVWRGLSINENLMEIITEWDYDAMKKAIQPLAEELARWINNPRKYSSEEEFLKRQCELGFIELEDIECEM